MPRRYIRKVGKRPYAQHSETQLRKALEAARSGKSLREVEKEFGVKRSTLSRHLNNKQTGKYGRPSVFSEEDEEVLVECISAAGEWGFPFKNYDVRCFVKCHLDRIGVKEKRFKNNFPGEGWAEGFLNRHQDKLTTRLSQNIKRSRAAVGEDAINAYFDELQKTLENVEPPLIINYDETNITDDPKRQKVIVRRGCKHPEKLIDASKSSTSVMFAATGDGHLLPPYVCYKAEHLYNTWTEGGPPGTVYNRTKSGWFVMSLFEDWFEKIIMPYINQFDKEKPKVLIGDNLASHVSKWVIDQCIENNIRFVLLPPNSTGLSQPLDVAYFRPLKAKWSEVLTEWKMKNRGVVPKDTFPRLLKKCLERLADNSAKNIKAGFRGSGLIPLNRNEVLKRLPGAKTTSDNNNPQSWVDSMKYFLQEMRNTETEPLRISKKKRWNLKPGASITNEENFQTDNDKENQIRGGKKKKNNHSKDKIQDGSSDTDADISLHDTDDDIDFLEIEDDYYDDDFNDRSILVGKEAFLQQDSPIATTSKHCSEIDNTETKIIDETNLSVPETRQTKNSFIVVKFLYNEGTKKETEKYYMAQIIDYSESHLFVKVMRKSAKAENTFIFPNVDDEQLLSPSNMVREFFPISVSRGRYLFPKSINKYKLE